MNHIHESSRPSFTLYFAMKSTTIHRLLFAVAATLAVSVTAHAASIGVNLGDATTVPDQGGSVSGSAGVVPQINWMNVGTTTAAGLTLSDNTGSATTAALTYSGNLLPIIQVASNVFGDDERLNNSYLASFSSPLTFTITGVPYAKYDLITYVSTIFTGRTYSTTVGATTLFGKSPNPTGAGYIDNAATPYTYTSAIGTTAGTATTDGNYFRFNGLTASTLTFDMDSTNDVAGITAFQIVEVPEPGGLALLGFGAVGVYLTRKKRKRNRR